MSVQLFHNKSTGGGRYFSAIGTGFARAVDAKEKLGLELAILCIVGLAYGGGHLATWNNTFATIVEQWMWRTCAIITACAVGAPILGLQQDLILLGRKFCASACYFSSH